MGCGFGDATAQINIITANMRVIDFRRDEYINR